MKKELKKSTEKLYDDIDTCISNIIKSRIQHNTEEEGRAIFMMESLMVATLQQLTCIFDYFKYNEKIIKDCIHFLNYQKQHHADTSEIEECINYLENLI